MSNTRYIEFSSSYRNRKVWPLASEFEILISQTGTNNKQTAVDPVSLAMPLFSWSSNNLLLGGSATIPVLPNVNTANIATPAGTNTIGYTSDSGVFIIVTLAPPQQLQNYYFGLVINDVNTSGSALRRVVSSYYLGLDSAGKYRTQIATFGGFSDALTYGDKVYLTDPTDFTDYNTPLVFIPNGQPQDNAYNNYLLYNETINQYRPVLRYDSATNILVLDTSGSATATNSSGPITASWATTDNFSIRKAPPIIPPLGIANPTIASSTTTSITTTASVYYSDVVDFYKNSYIRILPYGSTVGATDTRYEYEPTVSNNKAYQIVGYDPVTATFSVSPPLTTAPPVGASIEILPYSLDNCNPFVYTGSLVSQQDMVCYELQLISLTMPNATLSVGLGGRIAFYPFVYVQISNVSSAGAGLKNIIYSNNPNSTSVIFRAPIYDIQNPLNTPYVRVDGGGMSQTIKFKPNDNLYVKITLPNGDLIKTILPETYSPSAPNPFAQITLLFSFRRI